LLTPQAGVSAVRLLGVGRPYAAGAGVVGQVTEFTALRLRDNVRVRGVLTAQVSNNSATGAYGFAAYLRAAPAQSWASWAPTLATIQKRIVFLGRG
jgi:hypothetical protein